MLVSTTNFAFGLRATTSRVSTAAGPVGPRRGPAGARRHRRTDPTPPPRPADSVFGIFAALAEFKSGCARAQPRRTRRRGPRRCGPLAGGEGAGQSCHAERSRCSPAGRSPRRRGRGANPPIVRGQPVSPPQRLTGRPLTRRVVLAMIKRRAAAAGLPRPRPAATRSRHGAHGVSVERGDLNARPVGVERESDVELNDQSSLPVRLARCGRGCARPAYRVEPPGPSSSSVACGRSRRVPGPARRREGGDRAGRLTLSGTVSGRPHYLLATRPDLRSPTTGPSRLSPEPVSFSVSSESSRNCSA